MARGIGQNTQALISRREYIIHEIQINNTPYQTILDAIADESGVVISRTTLIRYLKRWGIGKNIATRAANPADTQQLVDHITKGVLDERLTDAQIQADLTSLGHSISTRNVAALRRDLGLRKRVDGAAEHSLEMERMHELLTAEYDNGHINNYGAGMLYTYMREKYGVTGRNRLRQAAMRIDPVGFESRRKRLKTHRGAVIVPGPNYAWSMDAHLKLAYWGFEVYACIDVYSRKIIWTYVGITGRTQVSVYMQYLQAIRDHTIMPRIVRTDRGTETPRMADAHYYLSQLHRPHEDLTFGACFHYSTSTKNQRIEAWWRASTEKCLGKWSDLFRALQEGGTLDVDQLADRIALLAVYMPIIRTDHAEWVATYNRSKIRKQPKRPYVKAGVPNRMHAHPEEWGDSQQGIAVDPAILDTVPFHVADGFDLDEYLPLDTLAACSSMLAKHGICLCDISSREHLPDGTYLHGHAYALLRAEVQIYVRDGCQPALKESEKPLMSDPPRPELVQLFRDAHQHLEINGVVYAS